MKVESQTIQKSASKSRQRMSAGKIAGYCSWCVIGCYCCGSGGWLTICWNCISYSLLIWNIKDYIMMKKLFLVFGLLVFGTTSYSDVGQIDLIHQGHVNNDIENTVQDKSILIKKRLML